MRERPMELRDGRVAALRQVTQQVRLRLRRVRNVPLEKQPDPVRGPVKGENQPQISTFSYNTIMSQLSDEEFARAFENCELSNESFHHRDHLRLAWIYLRRYGEAQAIERIGVSIRNFAAHHGKSDKYSESVTAGWMRLMAEAVEQEPGDFDQLLRRFPELLDKSTLKAV